MSDALSGADMLVLQAGALTGSIARLVRAFGSDDAEARQVATNLVEANLTGHDSHGVGMMPRYVDAYLEGGLVPNARLRVVHDATTLLRLDGGAGFGQCIGAQAMTMAADRALAHGSCIVALGNSHHLGRIGAWAEQLAARGLVSLHLVNVVARNIVAPFGGADARFGTNPFCAGVPLPGREPVILDFATSVVAQGKTRVAFNQGKTLEAGLLLDDQGQPTTEPRFAVVPPFGALLAFGGHKGYGLALMCELLGGALAAGLTQRDADPTPRRVLNGMFSVVLDPRALGDVRAFEAEALAFLEWVQASPARTEGAPVQVAGDAERAMRARRLAQGVPVDRVTWQEILAAGQRLAVEPAELERLAGLR